MSRILAAGALLGALTTMASAGPWTIDRPVLASAADDAGAGTPLAPPAPRPMNPWKPIFVVSLGLAATSSVFAVYAHSRSAEEVRQITLTRVFGNPITDRDCGSATLRAEDPHFARACTWNKRSSAGMLGALGFGAFTAVAAYFAFRTPASDRLVLAPAVSRDGAGAELTMAW